MTDGEAQVGSVLYAAVLVGLICVGLAAFAVGCNDDPAEERSSHAQNGPSDSQARLGTRSGSSPSGGRGPTLRGDTRREGGSRTIRTPSGGLLVTPRLPTARQIEPAGVCAGPFRGPRGQKAYLPPKPGLAAEWQGRRHVLVTVAFGATPRRCRPRRVRLTLDVNDDGQPGVSRVYVFNARTQRVRLSRPPYLTAKPDVVAASAIDRRGLTGQAATVLISRGR